MNCLDYRRQRSAGETPFDAARVHLDSCTACQEFARRSQKFDQALQGALATPVPDGLADRVLFRRRNGFAWTAVKFAAAASVLLFITSVSQPLWLRGLAPADAVLAHVLLDEPFEKLTIAPTPGFRAQRLPKRGLTTLATRTFVISVRTRYQAAKAIIFWSARPMARQASC